MMKQVNIRIFRISMDGKMYFEMKKEDGLEYAFSDSLKTIAKNIRGQINDKFHLKDSTVIHVTIDFYPYHEVEFHPPRRCFPLTAEESNEFWKYFT